MTAMNASTECATITPEISILDGKPVITSRQIAEDFNKSHMNVIQDIEKAEISEQFRDDNFQKSEYSVEGQSRKYKQYILSRDGFTIIAMGYQGKKAMAFKEAYIAAFNNMEQLLLQDKPAITAAQLQYIREATTNCTRYLKHKSSSFSQVLYRQMKKEFGYSKIELIPLEQYDDVIKWIKNHEPVCHELYKISIFLEREFVRRIKERDYGDMDEIPFGIVDSCKPNALGLH